MAFLNEISGFLLTSYSWLAIPMILFTIASIYNGLPFFVTATLVTGLLLGFSAPPVLSLGFVGLSLFFIIKPLRQVTLSALVMKVMKALNIVPQISETERTALDAGVVWAEAELFSGEPNFKKLMDQPYPTLTEEEQAFLDGPVNELCEMVDSWKIQSARKIPENVWQFIKDEKFFGMIIPKEHGGLGFTNTCQSAVIQKLSTRSVAISITVMVPNSLGPAELLIHYGTEKQRQDWLPRLANGTEVPCFGLTEPQAGSDAGSITSDGTLFKGDDGKLYIKLNWRKRWITLAAISTVIGLAFRLRDPENLLGRGEDLGITCALIPADAEGVVIGRRHDPLSTVFYNCPTEGHDVVVDAEAAIIGGTEKAGQGWQMLMESLAAGRGVSIPAQGNSGTKYMARVASAHASIRKQFGLPIGKFEGVEEPLARIAGAAYYNDAMATYTLSALDQGIKPPVITAMAKYNASEWFRKAVNDAMDILGGAGISRGPRNLIAEAYFSAPISITVEGANILTRTLIIFGQGALRAHPFAYQEVKALEENNLKEFDRAFWGHIGHIAKNKTRAIVLSLTRGYIALTPGDRHTRRYFQKLAWASSRFAILADITMGVLGGKLKFKEKITGRFADVLSYMYTATAVLRRYEAEGRRKEDLPFVHYSLQICFEEIQKGLEGILANFEGPWFIRWIFRGPLHWHASLNKIGYAPTDELTHEIAQLIQQDSEQRDRLTSNIFYPKSPEDGIGRYERAFKVIKQSESIDKKIRRAIRKKQLPKKRIVYLLDEAVEKGVITEEEKKTMAYAEELRWDAIQVDSFTQDEYVNSTNARAGLNPPGTETKHEYAENKDDKDDPPPEAGKNPYLREA